MTTEPLYSPDRFHITDYALTCYIDASIKKTLEGKKNIWLLIALLCMTIYIQNLLTLLDL